MDSLTSRQMRGLFYAIEINLILWLVVAARLWAADVDAATTHVAEAGLVVTAILQHWAYYNLLRRSRQVATGVQVPNPNSP